MGEVDCAACDEPLIDDIDLGNRCSVCRALICFNCVNSVGTCFECFGSDLEQALSGETESHE